MAAEHRVAADRLAARKIGAFLRFEISTNPNVRGVGEGRKAAAEHWPFGGTYQPMIRLFFTKGSMRASKGVCGLFIK